MPYHVARDHEPRRSTCNRWSVTGSASLTALARNSAAAGFVILLDGEPRQLHDCSDQDAERGRLAVGEITSVSMNAELAA